MCIVGTRSADITESRSRRLWTITDSVINRPGDTYFRVSCSITERNWKTSFTESIITNSARFALILSNVLTTHILIDTSLTRVGLWVAEVIRVALGRRRTGIRIKAKLDTGSFYLLDIASRPDWTDSEVIAAFLIARTSTAFILRDCAELSRSMLTMSVSFAVITLALLIHGTRSICYFIYTLTAYCADTVFLRSALTVDWNMRTITRTGLRTSDNAERSVWIAVVRNRTLWMRWTRSWVYGLSTHIIRIAVEALTATMDSRIIIAFLRGGRESETQIILTILSIGVTAVLGITGCL